MPASSPLVFRDASLADLPAIVDLLADDFLGARRGEDPGSALGASYFEAFEDIQSDPRNQLIVAERNGAVVGCCQITFAPGLSYRGALRAIIEGVRIAAPLRGQGFGRMLIEYAIELSRRRGARFVQLTTNKQREGARRFYASLGFAASHEGFMLEI